MKDVRRVSVIYGLRISRRASGKSLKARRVSFAADDRASGI